MRCYDVLFAITWPLWMSADVNEGIKRAEGSHAKAQEREVTYEADIEGRNNGYR